MYRCSWQQRIPSGRKSRWRWRVFFKRQVGMFLDDFVEINSSDLLWTCFRVVLFPPWQFQWNLCCLKFQETFGRPCNAQVTTFHGFPPLKRRFSAPFQMAGGSEKSFVEFSHPTTGLDSWGIVTIFQLLWCFGREWKDGKFQRFVSYRKIFHKLEKMWAETRFGPRSLDITKGHKSFTLNLLQICFACVFLAQRCSANVGVCSVWLLSKRVALNTGEKCRDFLWDVS